MDKYFSEEDLIKFIKWYIKRHFKKFNQVFEEYKDGFQDMFLYVFSRLHKYNEQYSKATFLNLMCRSGLSYYQSINGRNKRKAQRLTKSISAPISEGSDLLIEDIIPDDTDYFQKISDMFDFEKIKKFLNADSRKFFLEQKSLAEIGKDRNVSRETIRQSIISNIRNIRDGNFFGRTRNATHIGLAYDKFTDEEKVYFDKSVEEIAKELNISRRTVFRKRNKILEKYKGRSND